MLRKERTTHSDALVVLAEMPTHYRRFAHVYTEIRFHEINGCQNRQIGIALAGFGFSTQANFPFSMYV